MSASADLVCIHPQNLREIWPFVSDRLRAAYLRTDLGHTADLERDLFEGDGLLWLAMVDGLIEAAAVTMLQRTDRHLVCVIMAVGGEKMGLWLDLLGGIERWAKDEGAALVRVYGRPGWVRMLKDYRVKNVVLEKSLG